MLRSPVKLLEDYNRAFNLETREKIWREVIKDLREEKNPSYALTALFPLSERPEAQGFLTYDLFSMVRTIARNKEIFKETRIDAIFFLRKFCLKEREIKGNLETYDVLYNIMRDEDEDMDIREWAGLSLCVLGGKWLIRHVQDPNLAETLETEGKFKELSPLLKRAIGRWENAFFKGKDISLRLNAAILLSIPYKSAFKHLSLLLGFLEGTKGEDELSNFWKGLAIAHLKRLKPIFQEGA